MQSKPNQPSRYAFTELDKMGAIASQSLIEGRTEEGIALLRAAYIRGSRSAGTELASYYLHGIYVEPAPPLAHEILRLLVRDDYPPAVSMLGEVYRDGLGLLADDSMARSLFEKAAAMMDTDGMYDLALDCLYGPPTRRDVPRGIRLLEEATVMGCLLDGYYALARCYEEGYGMEPDLRHALELVTLTQDPERPDPKITARIERLEELIKAAEL